MQCCSEPLYLGTSIATTGDIARWTMWFWKSHYTQMDTGLYLNHCSIGSTHFWLLFILCPYLAVLRELWLGAQGALLGRLILGIKPMLAACKGSILSTLSSPWLPGNTHPSGKSFTPRISPRYFSNADSSWTPSQGFSSYWASLGILTGFSHSTCSKLLWLWLP